MLPNKIVIAGCGLSGMITALAFARYNIPTIIIERRSVDHKDFFNDIRTTALTASSKKFFEHIGIWDKLSEVTGVFNDIYVIDNRASDMIHFASSSLKNDMKMGYLIQNTDFKKLLFSAVSSNELIHLIKNTEYEVTKSTELGCAVSLDNGDIHECDLLIVCDGRGSKIRRRYFSSNIEKSYNQYAITFVVYHEKQHEGTSVEHFMTNGPFAILPLKDQNISSVVWTIKSDQKDVMMSLPRDEFSYLVQQNFGQFLGKITIQGDIAAFPLSAYETKKYYNKKIVLVSDTAHIIHPLAGQGLNQGIKDIATLARLIQEYGASDYALEEYQSLRKPDNRDMFELTDAINALFSNDSKILYSMRQIGFKAIERFPSLKGLLVKYAMGKR